VESLSNVNKKRTEERKNAGRQFPFPNFVNLEKNQGQGELYARLAKNKNMRFAMLPLFNIAHN
jgi:hypothetical protein